MAYLTKLKELQSSVGARKTAIATAGTKFNINEFLDTSTKTGYIEGSAGMVDAVLQQLSHPTSFADGLVNAERLLLGTKITLSTEDVETLKLSGTGRAISFLALCRHVSGVGMDSTQVLTSSLATRTGDYVTWETQSTSQADTGTLQALFLWVLVAWGYKGKDAAKNLESDKSATATLAAKSGVGTICKIPAAVVQCYLEKPSKSPEVSSFHREIARLIIGVMETYPTWDHAISRAVRSLAKPLWVWTGPGKSIPALNAHLELLSTHKVHFLEVTPLFGFVDLRNALDELLSLCTTLEKVVAARQSEARVLIATMAGAKAFPHLASVEGSMVKTVLTLLKVDISRRRGGTEDTESVRELMYASTSKGIPQDMYDQCVTNASAKFAQMTMEEGFAFEPAEPTHAVRRDDTDAFAGVERV